MRSKIVYGLDNRINHENQELKFNCYPMKYHIQIKWIFNLVQMKAFKKERLHWENKKSFVKARKRLCSCTWHEAAL